MPTRSLPAATRNAVATVPAATRNQAVLPGPSRRVLSDRDVPPLPQFKVIVAADVVVVVQQIVTVRAIARVPADFSGEVTASASARADGGRKEVDAEHEVTVTATATAVARFHRSGTVTANVAVIASAGAAANAAFGAEITPTASVDLVRTAITATQQVSVTAVADVVAIGGQIPVDAVKSIEATATATAFGRIYRDAIQSVELSASMQRLIRMTASAAQTAVVTATADVRVPVTATASVSVTASATARPSFTPMGMEKSGTQVTTANSTETTANTVVDWVPLAAYPGTVITDNALVVKDSGSVKITATATISSSGSTSHSRGIHLLVDGVIVATDQTTVGSQTSFSITYTGTIAAGQKVGVAAWVRATTSGYRNLTAAQIVVTAA